MQAAEESTEGDLIPTAAALGEREPMATRFGLSRETGSGTPTGHVSVPAVAPVTLTGAALLTCAVASLANLVQQADRVIMPIAVIPMAEEHGWDKMMKGWALSAFAVGYISVQPIAGWTSTKVTPLLLLWVAVLGCSSSTIVVPLATSLSFGMLILSRICLGLTEGFCLPAIFQLFTNRVPAHFRATAFSIMVGCGNVGMLVALLVCPLIKPWRWMFIGFGMAGLSWCCFVAATSGFMSPSGKEAIIDSEGEDTAALKSENATQLEGFALYRQILSSPAVIAICVAHFAQNWTNYTMNSWLPTYLHEELGVPVKSLWLTAFPYFAMTVANISAGYVADAITSQRLASVRTVRIAATTVGLVGPAICHLLFATATTARMALGIISISYLLGGATSSGYMANHADISSSYAGLTFSVANTLATVPGIAAGPFTAWLLARTGGWTAVFVVACFINLAAAGVYMLLAKAHRVL
mmetsp:Transcript_10875/g.24984  ORF Transcript_10875/g.24984 Transcript_10875/m.24984 type:complete len:469 (+) Transcript_10875:65-1471(+)